MGPKVFSVRKGETLYSLRLLPVGGFCQMLGDDSSNPSERAFNNKSVWQRIVVIISGVLMNIILAFVIFFVMLAINGTCLPKVKNVFNCYPAYQAGLKPGDYIYKINNNRVNIVQDLDFYMSMSNGEKMNLVIKRGKKLLALDVKPAKMKNNYILGFEKDIVTGLFDDNNDYKKIDLVGVVHDSFFMIMFYIKLTFVGLARLFSFKISLNDMSGPIGIVKVIGDTYNNSVKESISYTIAEMANFMAILSANIGIFNLLPIPALDGGILLFLLIEVIRHKPINAEKEGFVHLVGFIILMIFAAIVAMNDIIKII